MGSRKPAGNAGRNALSVISYVAKESNAAIRAFRDDVLRAVQRQDTQLVDVRSPQEFSGEVIHMAGYPQEGAQRAGHITGAKSIPWGRDPPIPTARSRTLPS